ncbi:hypothetical protein DFS34DRAFT_435182 [Phlyctochytrium arcticum]|nr:hypothetical protein DFS34DRAFT_435182 [Phlyctochytrium arcticum]
MSAIPGGSITTMAGLYRPNALQALYYGPSVVQTHLLDALPNPTTSRVFIVTGQSLATKTPLIKAIETLLGHRHAGTFSHIKQHAPVAQLDEATDVVCNDPAIDTIISVGGGSPIDSAKAISYRLHQRTHTFLRHIAIPTTLSAAECTASFGYTTAEGVKTGSFQPQSIPSFVFYDPAFAVHTPPTLFLSTAIRALDHAVELQYHPTATYMPCQMLALGAIKEFFTLLPQYKNTPTDETILTRLFLAAFASLGFLGLNVGTGGLGLSHKLGYALGSPYGIPHGITSCLTLGHVVHLKARESIETATQIAHILSYIPGAASTGDVSCDADQVGTAILTLVTDLGLKTTLIEKGVSKDQIDTIVDRATGGLLKKDGLSKEEKRTVENVRGLVEGLY